MYVEACSMAETRGLAIIDSCCNVCGRFRVGVVGYTGPKTGHVVVTVHVHNIVTLETWKQITQV